MAAEIPLSSDFVAWAHSVFGPDTAKAFLDAIAADPVVSISVNEGKWLRTGLQMPGGGASVRWASHGFYLRGRPRFTFDPLMHAGAYYVQEPSSMYVEQAYKVAAADTAASRVLDLCAAPGGKTLLLRGAMRGGLLVANEPIPKRAATLAENVAKWGDPDVVVTCNYPADFAGLDGFFDIILADVPCSGEGMFRKDKENTARGEWCAKIVGDCAERQRRIVADAWNSLRTGGYLIYSTCTFNRHEDEDNVAWIARQLGAEIVATHADAGWGTHGDLTGRGLDVVHFLPHEARGEGFFLALLKKTAAVEAGRPQRKGRSKDDRIFTRPKDYGNWIKSPAEYSFTNLNGCISAIHNSLADDFATIAGRLNFVSAGVGVCREKRQKGATKTLPAAELAMSGAFNAEAFPAVELGYADAVRYLRGETPRIAADVPLGRVCISYRGLPLGFANNVGSRLNNDYPESWRIRSTYAPTEPPQLEF